MEQISVNFGFCKIISILLAYIIVAIPGHLLVRNILNIHRFDGIDSGLKSAGKTIGYIERVLSLSLVLVGQYTTLILILTIKSIARFKQLDEREFAEYYIIGTLANLTFALLIGIITKYFIYSF